MADCYHPDCGVCAHEAVCKMSDFVQTAKDRVENDYGLKVMIYCNHFIEKPFEV